jgi:hypothetical protein
MFLPFKKPKVYRVTPDIMKYKDIADSNLYLGRDQAAIPP